MKRHPSLVTWSLAVALACLPAASARAQHPVASSDPAPVAGSSTSGQSAPAVAPPSIVEGAFTLGGLLTDNSGNQNRVGEYDLLGSGGAPLLDLQLWGESGTTRYDVAGAFGGDQQSQRYWGRLDVNRYVKAMVSYTRLPRRLDHDPLTYVDGGQLPTFMVRHDDTDPGATYDFARGELDARLEFAVPAAPGLRLFASHRQEWRDGFHQSLTTSHCANCHVTSYTRQMNQRTRDTSAGLRFQLASGAVDYRFEHRAFVENAPGLTHTYDAAVHPASLADVFYNRVQYDMRDGALPFDTTPGLKKNTHVINASVGLPGDARVTGVFTRSSATNQDTDLGTTYTGGTGRLVVPLHDKLTLRGAFRHYDVESDSVFVDVIDTVVPAGPAAGKTYEEAYPTLGETSFLRESSASRSPTDFRLELAYRPVKGTTINVGYDWESIARDHFEVEKTTTQTIKLSGRGRAGKALQWRVRFDRDWTTDPFAYEHAAIPAVLQPYPTPGAVPFPGLQYFEMYRSRQASLTSFPTRAARFDPSVTWSPAPRVSITGHYRYRTASNDDLNFSTWDQASHTPGAEVSIAAGDRWSLMGGYTYQRERLETMFSTLAFVG